MILSGCRVFSVCFLFFLALPCGSCQRRSVEPFWSRPLSTTLVFLECCLLFQALTLYLNEPIMPQNVFKRRSKLMRHEGLERGPDPNSMNNPIC